MEQLLWEVVGYTSNSFGSLVIYSDKFLTRLENRLRRKLQFVFIVAPGRSGSTLVQAVLNSIPGWKILGENAGTLQGLISSVNATASAQSYGLDLRKANDPWYGADQISTEEYATSLGSTFTRKILRPTVATRVTGFKEIRWAWHDLSKNLRDTQTIFPNARFVLNVRNPRDVAKSAWWKEQEDSVDAVSKIVSAIENTAAELADDTFLLRYEEYTSNPASLKALFDWLGEKWDEERTREILAERLTH